jgi:membrane protein
MGKLEPIETGRGPAKVVPLTAGSSISPRETQFQPTSRIESLEDQLSRAVAHAMRSLRPKLDQARVVTSEACIYAINESRSVAKLVRKRAAEIKKEHPLEGSLISMPSLWKLGGLTPLRLTQFAIKKMGQDELSTRSASLSYYFLLALFPMILFLLSLVGVFAGPGSQLRDSIVLGLGRLAPGSASDLIRTVVSQTFKSSSGVKLAAGILGALWAASGGMGAVVVSLNVIYGLTETRPWWKQKLTVVGLTLSLAGLIIIALILVLYGGKIGQAIATHVGLGHAFGIAWRILQWPVTFAAMFLSFSVVYYFAPNLEERKWFWVTPGAVVGVTLWLVSSLGFLYLHFFNRYSATYGSLGAVIILMLWLYMTGLAILIGGELNWVIESEDKKTTEFKHKKRQIQYQMKAA